VDDRFGPRLTLAGVAGLFTLGLFAIRFVASLAAIAAVTLLISNRNAVGVVTNTHIADALPDDIKGAGLGLLRSSWLLVAATGPTFVGYLADLGRFEDAFLVLAVAAAVATGLALFVPTE
jgi:5-enolpyruvylshikimate-3-phosphate synthase